MHHHRPHALPTSLGLSLPLFLCLSDLRASNTASYTLHSHLHPPKEDIFYTQMTVRETLLFHAKLRLPKTMSTDEKHQKVRVSMFGCVLDAGTRLMHARTHMCTLASQPCVFRRTR